MKFNIKKRLWWLFRYILPKLAYATLTMEGISMVVQCLSGLQIFFIPTNVLSYAWGRIGDEERKKYRIEIITFDFLTVKRFNETHGIYFTSKYPGFFVYERLASLCCGYLVVAPIPYMYVHIQDTIMTCPILLQKY